MSADGTTLITDDDALARLAPEWEELWQGVPTRTPFQSPRWLLAWWRQFGTGHPRVATLRVAGRLAGVLPCYLLAEENAAKLLPIGVSLSDYHDALIAPDAPPDAAAHLLAAVLDAGGVTRCDLLDLPPGAALLDAATPPGWTSEIAPGEPCPTLPLPAGAGFDEVAPAKIRRKLRMNRNRAERVGGWTVEQAGASELPGALDALIALHQARWTAQGEAGVAADVRVGRFLHEAAPALRDAGACELATLRIEGRAAAGFLLLRADPDQLYLYFSGIDERFASVSPGTLLIGALIEGAIADGVRALHFLRGDEAYKYAWGGVDRVNTTRRLRRA